MLVNQSNTEWGPLVRFGGWCRATSAKDGCICRSRSSGRVATLPHTPQDAVRGHGAARSHRRTPAAGTRSWSTATRGYRGTGPALASIFMSCLLRHGWRAAQPGQNIQTSPVQKWVGRNRSLATWKITAGSLGQDLTLPSYFESNTQINTWMRERERMRQKRRLIIIIKSLWDTHIQCFVTGVGCIVSVPVELNSKSLAIKSLILILNQIMSLWDLSVRAWVSEK